MTERDTNNLAIAVFFIIVMGLLLVGISTIHAQDGSNATFETSCYSDLTPTDAHIHIKYTDDAVEQYTVSTDAPSSNLPITFTTEVGTHELGWVTYTVDANYSVFLTDPYGNQATLPIVISEVIEGECAPVVPYTPDPDAPVVTTPACPASAVDQSTGQTYCYIPEPSGLVPLPPPTNYHN